ncbi:hypothetical protein B0H63DRAFT_524865 [Podospora didyma]|uniref:Uncharacterized protein n=1 Tax=Podospora didyma TaxID=330526 RepID=A0AAE0NBT6_9PEZI|nr:hypothetical protein B0H63DRAFT_524865 [Podospora didyma]
MSGKAFGHYFYAAGISPKELKVGNIALDYRVPTQNRPYQHEEPGQDLPSNERFLTPVEYPRVDIKFGDRSKFSLGVGMEGVLWLGPHWKDETETHLTADLMTEAHVQSGREDYFVELITKNDKAHAWLQRNLSAAFTVGAIIKRLFFRPKLWLRTGVVTIGKGTYEVTHEGEKGLKLEASDPTNTVPVGLKLEGSKGPSSTRKMDIASKTVIAAQWTLLYYKESPHHGPARHAGTSTVALISTEYNDIVQSEQKDIQLYYVSDDEEGVSKDAQEEPQTAEANTGGAEKTLDIVLLTPMFPEAGSEELRKFEEVLELLEKDKEEPNVDDGSVASEIN